MNAQRLYERLQQLVEVESPSEDAAAIARAHALVEAWARELGATATRHADVHYGDAVELHFAGDATQQPVLLLGHLDTVWPVGTLARMPFHEAKDAQGRTRFYGPGVLDMKAGVVMALEAIAWLGEAERAHPPIVLLLNPDEEIGSPFSRAITEGVARACQAVFVLEPAQGIDEAAYKTARKGIGNYTLRVTGVAAHSGVDFERGHSAVLELARLLQTVAGFTDLATGVTVNPGVIGGGTRSNVVAAAAWAEVDVRIPRAADAALMEQKLHALRCEDPACTVMVEGGINRPPMERSAGTERLFHLAQSAAAEMGIALTEASTGGGSDGNFTAAIGVPTLDGMGAVGEGAHAAHESVLVEQLVPRARLLAELIARL